MLGGGHLHDDTSSMVAMKVAFSRVSGFQPLGYSESSPQRADPLHFQMPASPPGARQEAETRGSEISQSHFSADHVLMVSGTTPQPLEGAPQQRTATREGQALVPSILLNCRHCPFTGGETGTEGQAMCHPVGTPN